LAHWKSLGKFKKTYFSELQTQY